MFNTYSYSKSALKYLRSNIGNQQDDLQRKIAKKGKNPQLLVGFFMFGFFSGFWVGLFGANPAINGSFRRVFVWRTISLPDRGGGCSTVQRVLTTPLHQANVLFCCSCCLPCNHCSKLFNNSKQGTIL